MAASEWNLFLDANILFSAAYQARNDILNLWKLEKLKLSTSLYALEEAKRNLQKAEQLERLDILTIDIKIVNEIDDIIIPGHIYLPTKDRPILAAAISAKANYLITGDVKDFGKYFRQSVLGVKILPPRVFFEEELQISL